VTNSVEVLPKCPTRCALPNVFEDRCGLRAAVDCEVVEDHDIVLMQGRGRLRFDIEVEEFPVHCPADDPRCVQPVVARGGDESLGLPMAKQSAIHEPRPALGPSARPGHLRLDRRFVDERKPRQHVTHEGLAAVDQDIAHQCDIKPLLLNGAQVFFVCQIEAAQPPPDRDALRLDPKPVAQFDQRFIKVQVTPFIDPPPDPVHHACQFAVPAAVALWLGLQRAGQAFQDHHDIYELDRNPELRRRSPMRVAFRNKINDPPTKLHRKWFTHQ